MKSRNTELVRKKTSEEIHEEVVRENQKENWKAYYASHKAEKKAYQIKNKEAIKAYQKEYKKNNKEKSNAKRRETYAKNKAKTENQKKNSPSANIKKITETTNKRKRESLKLNNDDQTQKIQKINSCNSTHSAPVQTLNSHLESNHNIEFNYYQNPITNQQLLFGNKIEKNESKQLVILPKSEEDNFIDSFFNF